MQSVVLQEFKASFEIVESETGRPVRECDGGGENE